MAERHDDSLDRKVLILTIALVVFVIVAMVLFALYGDRPDRLL